MAKYAVTLEYSATISVEANTAEEAEDEAQGTDITEVIDLVGDGVVVFVELE